MFLILVLMLSNWINGYSLDVFVGNVAEMSDSLQKREGFLRSLEEWAKQKVKTDLLKAEKLTWEQRKELIDAEKLCWKDFGNGLKLFMMGEYALNWQRELTREEKRSSRDIFFYGRGDTAYVLYDKSDALQALNQFEFDGEKISQCIWRWPKKEQQIQEKGENGNVNEDGDIGLVMYPPRICMFFDGDKPEWVVDSAFVRRVRAIARDELVAFTRREDYRRQEQWKRTKNAACVVVFDIVLCSYFLVTYLLIPTEDGQFIMYRVKLFG